MYRLALTALLFLAALPAHAAVSVIEHTVIDREQVVVGDLFTVSDNDLALKPVGDAPTPGNSNTYDVQSLRRVAKAYNIAWNPTRLDTRAVVKRDATEITNEQILGVVRTSLAERMKNSTNEADSVEIMLDRRTLNVQLPANVKQPSASFVDIDYNPVDYRFKGMLMVEATENMTQPVLIPITGRAMPLVNVPVLLNGANRGDIMNETDLEYVAVPINKVTADMITQASDVVGKELRRDLPQGQVLRSRDFRTQQLVKRGSIVTMVIEHGPMRVTVKGKALGDAGVGDTVRVLNTSSNRTIEGKVLSNGNVAIAPSI